VAIVDRQVAHTWDDRIAGSDYRQQVMAKAKKTKPREQARHMQGCIRLKVAS
jgi:hypothetical protein